MNDRHLHWTWKNRAHRRMPIPIGPVLRKTLDHSQVAGSAIQRRLVLILEEHVGGQLLDHASVVGVKQGVLTFYVSEPAVSCQLRLQWEQRLLQLLQVQLPGAGITEIRFTTMVPG